MLGQRHKQYIHEWLEHSVAAPMLTRVSEPALGSEAGGVDPHGGLRALGREDRALRSFARSQHAAARPATAAASTAAGSSVGRAQSCFSAVGAKALLTALPSLYRWE